jgi:hypothetical protein
MVEQTRQKLKRCELTTISLWSISVVSDMAQITRVSDGFVWRKQSNAPIMRAISDPEFSIIAIRVRGEIGARHVIDRSYRCVFTIARTASEFHIHSAITKHQKTGSAILAEITMRLMVYE